MFVTNEKNVFTMTWPSLTPKIGKQRKTKFGRIDSRMHYYESIEIKIKKKMRKDEEISKCHILKTFCFHFLKLSFDNED